MPQNPPSFIPDKEELPPSFVPDPEPSIIQEASPEKSLWDKSWDVGKNIYNTPVVNRFINGPTPENTPQMKDWGIDKFHGSEGVTIPGVQTGANYIADKLNTPYVSEGIRILGNIIAGGVDPGAVVTGPARDLGIINKGQKLLTSGSQPVRSVNPLLLNETNPRNFIGSPSGIAMETNFPTPMVNPALASEVSSAERFKTPNPLDYSNTKAGKSSRFSSPNDLIPSGDLRPAFPKKPGEIQQPWEDPYYQATARDKTSKRFETDPYIPSPRTPIIDAIPTFTGKGPAKSVLDSLKNPVARASAERVLGGAGDQQTFDTLSDVIKNISNDKSISEFRRASMIDSINAKSLKADGSVPNNPSLLAQINSSARSALTSYDLSGPGKQGMPLWQTKAFWTSLDDQVKSWGSEKFFEELKSGINNDPLAKRVYSATGEVVPSIVDRSGLKIPGIIEGHGHEERFGKNFVEKHVPGIQASERAYEGGLGKMRFDYFKSLYNTAEASGLNVNNNGFLRALGDTVNKGTGIGTWDDFMKSHDMLDKHMFAPNFTASRFRLIDPRHYYDMKTGMPLGGPEEWFIRKERMKQFFALVSGSMIKNGLYGALGAKVGTDILKSDFAKSVFKQGDKTTTVDPNAGVEQPLVLGAQVLNALAQSASAGITHDPEKAKFGAKTAMDSVTRFGISRLQPLQSLLAAALVGTDFDGQPFEVKRAILNRITPIAAQDIYETATQRPDLAPILIPGAILGEGANTYTR